MNTILLTMSICSFILGCSALFAKWTGNFGLVMLIRMIGLFATITPIIYWLVLLSILNP